MILLMFIMLYPVYYIAIVSISGGREVLAGTVAFYPKAITLESYKLVFANADIFTAYGNTFLYTGVGTFVNILMTMLCAYPLAQPKLPGKSVIMKIIVFTMFFSGGMIPSYLLIKQLHLLNSIWAIVLPGAISTYNMILARTFLMGLPHGLVESAYLDGANDFQVFYKIMLPLSKPIIATLVLFYAVGHWNSYMDALLYLNDKSLYPLQLTLRNMIVQGQMGGAAMEAGSSNDFVAVETTLKCATIMIATLPILMVYPFVQKYFVKGVMVGSLKG